MTNHLSATELTITIKNSEQRYTQKFLINDVYAFNELDPIIAKCLEEAKGNFKGSEIEDIKIKASLSL